MQAIFFGDVQGTSYPPWKSKMYDLGLLSEAKEGMEGQGLAPAAAEKPRKKLEKIRPSENHYGFFEGQRNETSELF